MAETRRPLYRTLAAVPLAAALAGCAATHVGDDWQCPLAQGEVCTSIAAADPAVAPEREPPALATRTPLYRAPESEAVVTEAAAETKAGTKTRPCAEGCNLFAWLGRLLSPRGATAETSENDEAVFTVPTEETAAPAGTGQAGETPCAASATPLKPAAAPVDADDGAEPIDDAGTPCPIVVEAQETTTPAPVAPVEPIAPSTAAVLPCGTDDAPAEPPVEAESTAGAPVSEDAEAPCAGPASAEETVAAEDAEGEVAAAEDTPPPPADRAPSTSAALLAPAPAPDALRTGEVVGRIWIAPFVDAGGVYREGAWVRAVLAPAGWRR